MSSGTILIYDKSGVDLSCLHATYKQIKEQADDRSLKVDYFSQNPELNDTVRLFVIPGGNYTKMADELKPLAPRIRKLVLEEGSSYLGICAGAIAAAQNSLLMCMKKFVANQPNPEQEMFEMTIQGRMHLQLYSGNCCYFDVPGGETHGTQEVRKYSKSYHLYFNSGVFFPSAPTEPHARALLTYTSYTFSGWYQNKTYENIVPVAAVTQRVGKGRLLLSGVHPEIGPDTVDGLRNTTEEDRNATMREFLSTLSILTKKV